MLRISTARLLLGFLFGICAAGAAGAADLKEREKRFEDYVGRLTELRKEYGGGEQGLCAWCRDQGLEDEAAAAWRVRGAAIPPSPKRPGRRSRPTGSPGPRTCRR